MHRHRYRRTWFTSQRRPSCRAFLCPAEYLRVTSTSRQQHSGGWGRGWTSPSSRTLPTTHLIPNPNPDPNRSSKSDIIIKSFCLLLSIGKSGNVRKTACRTGGEGWGVIPGSGNTDYIVPAWSVYVWLRVWSRSVDAVQAWPWAWLLRVAIRSSLSIWVSD